MEREEAEVALSSLDANVRLDGARFYGREAKHSDRLRLRRALKVETVPWNKRALERALVRAEQSGVGAVSNAEPNDAPNYVLAELRAQIIEDIAGTLIHELSKPIGSMRMVTPGEMDGRTPYEGSRTEARIETLARLLSGIRSLKSAVARPTYTDVNLGELVREVCAASDGYPRLYKLAGPSPFSVVLDPNLFRLALSNLVRNAVEALQVLPEKAERTITINWGRGGRETWLTVIDTGLGFEGSPKSMLALGKTSKEGHIGFGLATVREAMNVLEGDVFPENSADGGASVTLRWIGSDEDSIR